MTTAVGVGAGLNSPMATNPIITLAHEFYCRNGVGNKGSTTAFSQFVKAKKLSIEDSKKLQDYLISRYGLYELAARITYSNMCG